MKTGARFWLPSGAVVEVRRLGQKDGQFIADCCYVRGGRRFDRLGSATLTVAWLERYGRATV